MNDEPPVVTRHAGGDRHDAWVRCRRVNIKDFRYKMTGGNLRAGMRVISTTIMVGLLALGLPLSAAAGEEPVYPQKIGRFEQQEALTAEAGRSGSTAGYVLVSNDLALSVTVGARPARSLSLLPILDRSAGSPEAVAAVMDRAVTRVSRFYPAARALERRAALLVRDGALRHGEVGVFEFDDLFGGEMRPIRMEVHAYCCSATGQIYEYWFRYPAAASPGLEIARFLRDLPWH